MPQQQFKSELKTLFENLKKPPFTILYGSTAEGKATWKSDIDILFLKEKWDDRESIINIISDVNMEIEHQIKPEFKNFDQFKKQTTLMEEILKTVVEYFDSNDIEYVLVGGIAVIVYGNPRTTVDLDLVVKIDKAEMRDFAAYLQREGFFSDVDDMKQAFEDQTHFSAEERDSLFRLDIKGVYDQKDKVTLKNRKKIEFEGITMYVASPEDTIANKLYYGSEQDIEDAEGIYVRQEDELDYGYLEERCEALEVMDELRDMEKEIAEFM